MGLHSRRNNEREKERDEIRDTQLLLSVDYNFAVMSLSSRTKFECPYDNRGYRRAVRGNRMKTSDSQLIICIFLHDPNIHASNRWWSYNFAPAVRSSSSSRVKPFAVLLLYFFMFLARAQLRRRLLAKSGRWNRFVVVVARKENRWSFNYFITVQFFFGAAPWCFC